MKKISTLTTPLLLLTALACDDDPTRPDDGGPREHAAVVNSVSATVSIFPLSEPDSVRTVALDPLASATTIAVRDYIALVPLGLYPAVAVIDLEEGVVIDEIALPANSGATGVAIVNDSLAFVANPMLNSVTPVLYRKGIALDAIPVGTYPTGLLALGDRVYVVEANLVAFTPAGPSTISVIDTRTLQVTDDFALSGRNAADAATNGAHVFVVNAGDFDQDSMNASLSIVDVGGSEESSHHPGFGSFASEVEVALSGVVVVSSHTYGLALFDPEFDEFIVEPGAGFGASGANVLGFGLDSSQRLWVIDARDCASPGRVVRVNAVDGVAVAEATVEWCPDAIDFGIF